MAALKLGSTGPRVTALQQLLQQRGFDPGSIDGQFGDATDAAVRAFQASVGLAVDGQAGSNTFAALEAPHSTSNVTTDLANDPTIAAQLLAAFLKDKEDRIRAAIAANDLATARKLVNGGSHGLADFTDAFERGLDAVPDDVQVSVQGT